MNENKDLQEVLDWYEDWDGTVDDSILDAEEVLKKEMERVQREVLAPVVSRGQITWDWEEAMLYNPNIDARGFYINGREPSNPSLSGCIDEVVSHGTDAASGKLPMQMTRAWRILVASFARAIMFNGESAWQNVYYCASDYSDKVPWVSMRYRMPEGSGEEEQLVYRLSFRELAKHPETAFPIPPTTMLNPFREFVNMPDIQRQISQIFTEYWCQTLGASSALDVRVFYERNDETGRITLYRYLYALRVTETTDENGEKSTVRVRVPWLLKLELQKFSEAFLESASLIDPDPEFMETSLPLWVANTWSDPWKVLVSNPFFATLDAVADAWDYVVSWPSRRRMKKAKKEHQRQLERDMMP